MKNNNDYEKLMAKLGGGFDHLSDTVNRNGLASIKQTQQSEANLKQHISTGFDHLSDTVNRNGLAGIRQTQQSEAALSAKIDRIRPAVLKTADYLVILVVTILFGVIGWLFSNTMISHGFSPWVDRGADIVRDAAGNLIATNPTVQTVWVVVVVTIALFAIVGMTLSYTVLGDLRDKEG